MKRNAPDYESVGRRFKSPTLQGCGSKLIGADGTPVRTTRRATYVFRLMPDGAWLCLVDNSYGADRLDPE